MLSTRGILGWALAGLTAVMLVPACGGRTDVGGYGEGGMAGTGGTQGGSGGSGATAGVGGGVGGSGGGTGGSAGIAGSGGVAGTGGGCSTAPWCGDCRGCVERCTCETGDPNMCFQACGGSGGSTGGVGGGVGGGGGACGTSILGATCEMVSFGSSDCDKCMQSSCCSEVNACFGDLECAGLIECLSTRCAEAPDPWQCAERFCGSCLTPRALDLLEAFGNCYDFRCGRWC
jgi:hypothetical protein